MTAKKKTNMKYDFDEEDIGNMNFTLFDKDIKCDVKKKALYDDEFDEYMSNYFVNIPKELFGAILSEKDDLLKIIRGNLTLINLRRGPFQLT